MSGALPEKVFAAMDNAEVTDAVFKVFTVVERVINIQEKATDQIVECRDELKATRAVRETFDKQHELMVRQQKIFEDMHRKTEWLQADMKAMRRDMDAMKLDIAKVRCLGRTAVTVDALQMLPMDAKQKRALRRYLLETEKLLLQHHTMERALEGVKKMSGELRCARVLVDVRDSGVRDREATAEESSAPPDAPVE